MERFLEDDLLRVTLMPDEGGRISSIKSLESGVEFLLQTQPGRGPLPTGMEAAFREGACAGIEECLPSVGACSAETDGGPVPDHGDFWQLAWELEEREERSNPLSYLLSATGFSRPLRFTKRVSLRGRVLHLNYGVENVGWKPGSFLYACHPLLAVEEGDRIVLPGEITELQLYGSRKQRLGRAGATIDWPLMQEAPRLDLSYVLADTSGVGDMLYTARLRQGCCGLYRAAGQQGILLRFDTMRLPYLGLWLCYGGWPEGGSEPRQYAVALEPTTAPCGTLHEAHRNGLASVLSPGESNCWDIAFDVSEPGLSLEQFKQYCFDSRL